jgi:hypothetical protein
MRWVIGIATTLTVLTIVTWFLYAQKPAMAKKIVVQSAVAVEKVPNASPSLAEVVTLSSANVVDIVPRDGEKQVVLDIDDPVIVRFDRSMKDFFVDFRFEPSMPVAYENNADKTEFKLLPKESLLPGTTYALRVFAKYRGMSDQSYGALATSQFTTLAADLPPAETASARKLSLAKRDASPLVTEGKYIDIALATQTMVIFENGKPLDAYSISSGKRGMETPKGNFKVQNKALKPWSKAYGLYMPHWMAITPGGKIGIHELPEWPGGYKEGASHLGTPVSHGCVRLGVGASKRVWDWADVGTPVIVH